MVFSLLHHSFYWQNASQYHYFSYPPTYLPPFYRWLVIVVHYWTVCCANVLCIVPGHGSEVVICGTVSNERRSERAELIWVSAPLAPVSIINDLWLRATCPLGTPSIFTGNNQGNLGDVSSVLLRSVCGVRMYICICIYTIVTTFVVLIMLWTVSKIGNMFLW